MSVITLVIIWLEMYTSRYDTKTNLNVDQNEGCVFEKVCGTLVVIPLHKDVNRGCQALFFYEGRI